MDYATLITLIAVALFLTGTPVLLVISGWVIATSYFVVEFPLINVGLTANEAVQIYVFLAVPLFVATGDLLTAGGISKKTCDLCTLHGAVFTRGHRRHNNGVLWIVFSCKRF